MPIYGQTFHPYSITLNKRVSKYDMKTILKMLEFMQNYWGQHDIINKIKILSKQGLDKIHDVISTKYQKYPFNPIPNMLMF